MGRTRRIRIALDKQDVTQGGASVRNALVHAGLAYLAFVIYGSLVPLEFHARSWDSAWQAFMAIPYLDLGIGSRADWVANILLFIPLAFIWLGILWHRNSRGMRLLASFAILVLAVALDVGIEFTQLFFPPRTVSLNDIFAETIGGGMGIVLWWIYGEKLLDWLSRWTSVQGNSGLAKHLLQLYLFALFAYNLLPLDLTLSPVEIYHKWREGRVILIPFGFTFDNLQQELYGQISDVVTWIPVAFLWRLSSRRPEFSIWLCVIGASALLEFLQLFVYTRVTNVTQIFAAGLGAVFGLLLVNLLHNGKSGMANTDSNKGQGILRPMLWLVSVLLWVTVMVTVFWYPFDFHFSRKLAAQHLPEMFKIPFVAYYYGTEYRAATEVLHKMGFFLPLGVLLGVGVSKIRDYFWQPIAVLFAVVAIGLLAMGIELGQMFLPGKNADITDFALELLGGWLGYWGATKLYLRSSKTHCLEKENGAVRSSNSVMPARQDTTFVRPSPVNREDNHA